MSQRVPITLYSPSTCSLVAAELVRELSRDDLAALQESWRAARVAVLQLCLLTNRTPPEHFHWDWRRKAQDLDFAAFEALGIFCEGFWQGALLIDKEAHRARLPVQLGKPLVYLDYMETAPWNLSAYNPNPPFAGVGTRFLAASVEISAEEEYAGRIGLHSLPSSAPFYRGRGLVELGDDPAKQNLAYFEADTEIAERLKTGRKP